MSDNTAEQPFAKAFALKVLTLYPNWYFFPIRADTKNKGMPDDNLDTGATNDPARIAKWQDGCNVGIALRKSGLIGVDVDTKPGKIGAQTLAELEAQHGPMPATLTVRTTSGGIHRYYNATELVPYRFALGKNGFGIDIDVPNYLVIPGSTYQGKLYRVLDKDAKGNGLPVVDAPSWFGEYLKDGGATETEQVPDIELDLPSNIERMIHYLKHDAKPSIQGSNGEFTLLMVAGILKDNGISMYETINLMATYYNVQGRCNPLWSIGDGDIADRLDVKVTNAWTYLKKTRPGANTPQADFPDRPGSIEYLEAWWREQRRSKLAKAQDAFTDEIRNIRKIENEGDVS